jgi:hypothetical protein
MRKTLVVLSIVAVMATLSFSAKAQNDRIAHVSQSGTIIMDIPGDTLVKYLLESLSAPVNIDSISFNVTSITDESGSSKYVMLMDGYNVFTNSGFALSIELEGTDNGDIRPVAGGNKKTEGCIGDDCTSCKLANGGCDCSGSGSVESPVGHCNHFVSETEADVLACPAFGCDILYEVFCNKINEYN